MLGKLFFWRKKKNNEEDEYEEDELEEESKPKKSKKRKKKAPPKPWGKRERLLVLSVLIVTVAASGFASLQSSDFSFPQIGTKKFSLAELNLFKEEKIVLYGTQDEEKDPTELINSIIDRTGYLQGEYSFAVIRLDTGFQYGLNEEVLMPAASLVKLPVMAAMFKAEEEDEIEFYEQYTLRNADKITGSGSLSSQPEGYEVTYQELIRLMGQQSDNTAYNISKRLAGISIINSIINGSNMLDTSLTKNLTTAEDIASFYRSLWQGELITSDHRDEMLGYLTDTIYEDWITKGVPDTVRVAHKYGTLENVVNDAGIVYANSPYILVILSNEVNREEANTVIPEMSRMVYEFEISD